MRICIGYIATNEEEMLRNFLPKIRKEFEVVAIDYESTDKTKSVFRENRCHVKTMKWPNHFGEAKNNLINFATEKGYDWIFVLDADEIIDPKWAKQIERVINDNPYEVYYLPRLNFGGSSVIEASVDVFPDLQARLFKLNVGYHYRNPTHCQLYKNKEEKCAWELKDGCVLPMYLLHFKGLKSKEFNLRSLAQRDSMQSGEKLKDYKKYKLGGMVRPLKFEVNY